MLPDATTTNLRESIVTLASRCRLPAVYPFRYFAVSGGLISYGIDSAEQFRQAANYVNRILKGENPSDLPVQAPTKFQLVVNLTTAKALGLTMPDKLLAGADEVMSESGFYARLSLHLPTSGCGTKRTSRDHPLFVRFRREADMRKKRQLRSKAPMAAAANKSQAAIRMMPPVGPAIGKSRCSAKARSAMSPENKAAPKTHATRAANANGHSRTPCCSNAAPPSTAAAWNRSI